MVFTLITNIKSFCIGTRTQTMTLPQIRKIPHSCSNWYRGCFPEFIKRKTRVLFKWKNSLLDHLIHLLSYTSPRHGSVTDHY